MLRSTALVVERAGRLSHVFGGIGAVGPFLYLLGRRPILFTAMIPGRPLPLALYDRVAHFVAQSCGLAAALVGAGVAPDRVDVIYPGVNLTHYTPQPPPDAAGRFRLLFASTPSDAGDIDYRGIGLLIELARLRPDIDIIVPWRLWGQVPDAFRIIESRSPSANFRVEVGDISDMAAIYRTVHATVCCFETGVGKSAPNFVVEGLASGRPALLADTCGIADVVAEWGAGCVTPRTLAALSAGVDDLRHRYDDACRQARLLAEREFNQTVALERYRRLYQRLSRRR
jgi:glycosyltransferase involved in cell wall biosynthesis